MGKNRNISAKNHPRTWTLLIIIACYCLGNVFLQGLQITKSSRVPGLDLGIKFVKEPPAKRAGATQRAQQQKGHYKARADQNREAHGAERLGGAHAPLERLRDEGGRVQRRLVVSVVVGIDGAAFGLQRRIALAHDEGCAQPQIIATRKSRKKAGRDPRQNVGLLQRMYQPPDVFLCHALGGGDGAGDCAQRGAKHVDGAAVESAVGEPGLHALVQFHAALGRRFS